MAQASLEGVLKMKKCYLVVDVQNDFVSGSLGFEGAQGVAERIAATLEHAKGDFVFTKDTHFDDYLETQEGRNLPVIHCIKGTPGWEIVPELVEFTKDATVFEKSSFGSPDLHEYFKTHHYDEVEIMGLVSNICVISSAVLVKTAAPEVQITVNASLTDSFDPSLHEKVLDVLKGLQVNVIEG